MFGVAANCANCKVLASQVFHNAKKERICADCIQKEYDLSCQNIKRAFDELYDSVQKNKTLEQKIETYEQKMAVYDAVLEQIKNFTQLVKKE